MKKIILGLVLGLLLSACATKTYRTGSYSEFVRLAKADGYTYFAQAHMPKFIFKDGPSDTVHSDYGSSGGASTASQQEANRFALKRCNHEDCILSRIGDEITLDARNIMREKIRLAVIEKENIERSAAIEKERIANYKNKNSTRIKKAENDGVSRGNIDYCISSFYNDDIEACFERQKVNLASNKNSYSVADQSTEEYQKFINENPGYKFYIWAQAKDLETGGAYAADNNKANATRAAINACNVTNVNCIVVYENKLFVKELSIINYYLAKCEKFGFKRNTDKIASCAFDLYKSEKLSNNKNSQLSENKNIGNNNSEMEEKINRNSEILEKLNNAENTRTTNNQLRVACKFLGTC
jgi:hypothetical protein